jgi:DNA replication protein DnaC
MAARAAESEAFRAKARTMFFSNEAVDGFLESATPGQLRAVCALIDDEQRVRARRKRERLFRKARFPQVKSFEGYDFSQVGLPDGYTVGDLRSLAFVDAAQDFVFHGPTGRGKTHLAIAIGCACVDSGREVRFFTAAELVLALAKARAEGSLDSLMRDLGRADLLIIDEFGYVPIDIDGARLLFQAVSACYEARSLVMTTNIEFAKWGTVLGDDKLASAMIDRIVHHGRLVEFGGPSRRMGAALMLGKAEGRG